MVRADGNVTINGSVEDATVISGGNIILKEGIHGGGQGSQHVVQASGTIKSKFIQNGNVRAGGDIETTFIQHSLIQSNSNVTVIGAKGRLAGGRTIARNSITTPSAGGRNSVIPTVLEVGNDPVIVERSRQLSRQIETLENQMGSLKPAIETLGALAEQGALTESRQEALAQAKVTYQGMDENMTKFQAEMEGLRNEMSSLGYGTVNIKQAAYPGVRIIIGTEQLLLETEYTNTTFQRIKGKEGLDFIPYQA